MCPMKLFPEHVFDSIAEKIDALIRALACPVSLLEGRFEPCVWINMESGVVCTRCAGTAKTWQQSAERALDGVRKPVTP